MTVEKNKYFDPLITYVSGGCTVVFVLLAILFPNFMAEKINSANAWTTNSLGWLYLLVVFGLTLGCLVLMIGPWGKCKLGGPDSKPDYANFTWFGLLFGSAIAAGIAFWGPAEPIYHYQAVPPYFPAEPMTDAAATAAMTQSFFHWGISAWAIYVALAIPLAHAAYTRNLPLRFSTAFYYLIGDRIHGRTGKIIDIFAIVATMGGLATTTGLTALQVVAGLKYHYHLDLGDNAGYVIIAAFTAVFSFAVYTGLEKGVKIMDHMNIILFLGVWLFIFLFGAKLYFIELGMQAGGEYLASFVPLSLFTMPGLEKDWLGGWTIFYWAWWASWAPFVSIFVARVSKGRSVRALVLGCMLLPSLANFLWYAVVGGAGIHYNIGPVLKEHGVEAAIFGLIQHYPAVELMAVVALVLISMLFLTSANSAAMSLAMFSTGKEHPHKYVRLFWALALGAVAMVLCGTGNLKSIQTASILSAVPLLVLLVMAMASTFIGVKDNSVEPSK
ncbi:MAG: BCCT family transporter [Deltaproteobacteria bacterium]|jgi:choline/glycine/proline betaine transport protein/glycine betaine transporter|nr:BCCT family transporter [Deltaproteobacteria bacterium]